MNKVLIFTATYNEAENISELITQIFTNYNDVDMLIVDDNSPDETYKIVEKLSLINKNIVLKKRESKLGLNTAHIFGYEYALQNKYEKFITMDADLSHDPSEISKILDLLDNYDFVIGSRYMKGGISEMPPLRLFLSIVGNRFIKFILNLKNTEYTSSYRGFKIKKLGNFHFNAVKSNGYSFFMETIFLINTLGFKILEFPIHFKNRKHGQSKIPKIEIFRTLFNVIKLFLKKTKIKH